MSRPDFPFLLSKRRHGSTGLAPRKVLKTASASAASVAPGLTGQLTSSQDAPQRGAQVAPVVMERAPEAGSSVEAAVTLGEAAGTAMASGPPDMLPALAPAAAEAVAVLAVERPVTADAEMAEASLLGASEEGGADPRPVPSSGSLVPARRSSDGRLHGQNCNILGRSRRQRRQHVWWARGHSRAINLPRHDDRLDGGVGLGSSPHDNLCRLGPPLWGIL